MVARDHTTQIMVGLLEGNPGILSLTQRIDFILMIRQPHHLKDHWPLVDIIMGVGNSNFGYFNWWISCEIMVDRITYSNDALEANT